MKILIGNAWPYANGSLHIGHAASLLPGDVLARYHRAKGDDVYLVSGSDCYGTPVAIRAKQENKTPGEVSDYYHAEFTECFDRLGFSYDLYGKTSSQQHQRFVTEFHREMYKGEYIYEKSVPQAYCTGCGTFLADRFVVGKCPGCGAAARGDQCDTCGKVLEPEALIDMTCSVCGGTPEFRETKHLFLAVSRLEDRLREFLAAHPDWRKNAITFTQRYIDEGLKDRAVTRDLDWGVDVPAEAYEGKKVYIWAENVLGYLSMSEAVCKTRGTCFEALWGDDARHYYVHGKDNIPFHTIILPSLLLAHGCSWRLPDEIISCEYYTLEGEKISTSRNHAIWIKDLIKTCDPDSLRYFFISNGPEKRDSDFSRNAFINAHNGELLGAYGNFVNRNLAFVFKYLGGRVPDEHADTEVSERLIRIFPSVGEKIEQGCLRDAIGEIFELCRFGNKYFDTQKPWLTRNTDADACGAAIFNCVQIIANLAVLLYPFLPFSSEKLCRQLNLMNEWSPRHVASGYLLSEPEILFRRIDSI